MDELRQLKEILYNILTAEEDAEGSVTQLYQNMGIQMTNAVKKEGVNIIQVQSVIGRITNGVVNALRIVDQLQEQEVQKANTLLLEYKGTHDSSIAPVRSGRKAKLSYERLQQVLDETGGNVNQVAEQLGMSPSYVYYRLKRHK